jgi:serine/threonine-protein kinase
LAGGLSSAEADEVAAHVECCPPCEQLLARLTGGPELRAGVCDSTAEESSLDFLDRLADQPLSELEANSESAHGSARSTPTPPDESPGPRSVLPPALPGYEVLGELGRGGMGVVYKARQVALKRLVALKRILPRHGGDPEQVARFRREAEAAARLQHPQIVQIHEIGEHEGTLYLALEFVDGGSLDRHLAGTPQPVNEAAALVETLARAMHYAHQHGVVHRDLKPANILLAFSCEPRVPSVGAWSPDQAPTEGTRGSQLNDVTPKIADFGLAKLQVPGGAGQTQSGAILGTPSYMAPEQAEGRKAVGPAVDVYALGGILYELLTGRPPFKAESALETLQQVCTLDPVPVRRLRPSVPRDLETICLKCLHKEPGRRYANALDLAEDLRRFRAGEPIRARPSGTAERCWRWCRRKPLAASLMAAAGLLLILAVGGAWWYQAQRSARQLATARDVAAALSETTSRLEEGWRLTDDPYRWQDSLRLARSAWDRAEGLLQSGEPTPELRERVQAVGAELEEADRAQNLATELEGIRLRLADTGDSRASLRKIAARYTEVFQSQDLDIAGPDRQTVVDRLRAHRLRDQLVEALEHWANWAPTEAERQRLREVVRVVDPDPDAFRERWREAAARKDRVALAGLADQAPTEALPAVAITTMGRD